MPRLIKDLTSGPLHPRELLFAAGNLAAVNAMVGINADGSATVGLQVTGVYVGTIAVEGTIDGANWLPLPVRPAGTNGILLLTLASAAIGGWQGTIGPYKQVRARMPAYTSGTAAVLLTVDTVPNEIIATPKAADQSVTVTAAIGVAATLSLPAPGAGLFQYLCRLIVQRHTGAVLTAAATPILVTTTNLPGARVLAFPADAAAQGAMAQEIIEPPVPIRASAANTAVTIVMPLTTGVIWRATADYYNAP